jgi:serine/threonine protein phosphatase 1
MEIVRKTIERWPGSRLFLGNHEKMFIDMLESPGDESLRRKFVRNGGSSTLVSYVGYDGPYSPEELASIAVRFQDHMLLMKSASRIETIGKYAFVHAGVDPHVAISEQDEEDLIWIKERFLDHVGLLSHIVVHGHTMLEPTLPVVTENRISLDTGAYHSGVLSMAVIAPETGAVEFYATHRDGSVQAVEPVLLERGYGNALTNHSAHEGTRSPSPI